jgi:hypothetical protein
MDITNKIKELASVDIFSLSSDSKSKLGNPFYLDYSKACLLIPDAYKQAVKGIPQGTFLLAFYDNGQPQEEALLLRAIRPTSLPTDDDNVKSMIEYYKDDLKTSGDDAQSDLDPETKYQFSFSGLECSILGTFYKNAEGETEFGADVENFYGAHNYNVFKPYGSILEKIVNFRDGEDEPGSPVDIPIGKVRYSSSRRFSSKEENIAVYINPKDFLGKRTALFGMTRTGKSNTVKKIIQATVEISSKATDKLTDYANSTGEFLSPIDKKGYPKFPIGQIIFDINGEYANSNMQDGGTAIYEMYKESVTRFSILEKEGFKVMRTNFYEDIFAGFELLKSVLIDDDARFVQNFCAVDLELPDDKKDDVPFMTEYNRITAAYKCCLKASGFEVRNNFVKFQGRAELNELTGINPSAGITLDQAINWFTAVWDAMGDKNKFFAEYKTAHEGNDWASDDLKALLVILTRKRKAGTEKDADCSGFRVLKKALEMHTAALDKPYYTEILEILRNGGIVIADLSQGAPELINLYSEKICRRIFNDSMERFIKNRNNNFIQMYFEEAHNLFPKKADTDLSDIYNRLAKEGAKLNLGILYATQEVSSISSNILKNTQNWFIAHLNNEEELRELKKYYDFGDFVDNLVKFSAKNDKGFIRMKTYSNPFTVPVQVDKFSTEN